MAVAAFLFAFGIAFWIVRSITRPLNEAVSVANRLAEGDMADAAGLDPRPRHRLAHPHQTAHRYRTQTRRSSPVQPGAILRRIPRLSLRAHVLHSFYELLG